MNLTTLDIDQEEAKARLAEYEKSLKEDRNAEDEAIAAGYRAAARGHAVISLKRAIEAGGFFADGLPRIAIVRADATQCWVRTQWNSRVVYASERDADNRGALVGRSTVRVDVPMPEGGRWRNGSTVVPIIPPRHRPRPRRLHSFHILWEVESWTPEPPKDPALLRHIRGDLWAVLATWDLTELERAVLSQRV